MQEECYGIKEDYLPNYLEPKDNNFKISSGR